jgi:hypothetical protein
MPQTVTEVLQKAIFYTDDQNYSLIKLPPGAIMAAAGVVAEIGEPFCALIIDKDEVTLLIPADGWHDFQHRLPGAIVNPISYRLITLDVLLEPDLVGLLAHISRALAEQHISLLSFGAFSRDHFFVAENQLGLALSTLQSLKHS